VSLALDARPFSALRSAERAVAHGIVRGLSNAEIARVRGTSVRTVANQVASLMRRLSAHSRAQIAARLANADLGSLDGHTSLR
jgi:DNA-binding NarL/FixJ family response regulator